MKLIKYLEVIQKNIYNELYELFKINVQKLSLKKITFNENKTEQLFELDDAFRDSGKKLSEVLEITNEQEAINEIKKFDIEDKSSLIKIYKTLNKIKDKDYYIKIENGGFDKSFIFFVNKKIYTLEMDKSSYITISFDEFNTNTIYGRNSIMSTGGSELFNKIAAIIKKEYTSWKTSVFAFSPVTEPSEDNKKQKIKKVLNFFFNILNKYLTIGINQSEAIKIKNLLNSINPAIKNKIKETLKIKMSLYLDCLNLIDFVFSEDNDKILTPANEPNKIPKNFKDKFKIWESSIVNDVYINFSMRTKLYKMIINQMFGNKVIVTPIEGNIMFSLSQKSLDEI
jgi:hypothetical protein